ncbi:peptidylprolyl isomerase [Isoptericola variabilis]|uniref:Peptidyl-prolyl cis-trans isomerase cyclophilin type n=1 Tax=Isoptericola variabilis (strain 225) TaxID=743718 RepID=F6FVG7_ISOV2|nr:peptidylprolyl isomerase [Isoptericola variabilis]AEG44394.1 peptidyl-prolyl cis-trans isomerase cyclophilin type [Isoptericola variabilis 225]TWH34387.1 peptidyl-prolyl cis-trans isomerase B (cyclophilin B) [Isoptericola variabilis J7]
MAASKRERDYARKRQAKWEQRQARARERRRRVSMVVALVAALALVGGGALVAGLSSADAPADVAATPSTNGCPEGSTTARTGGALPDPSVAEGRTWTATLTLCVDGEVSDVVLELDGENAPQAVASFVSLAQQGYFDDTHCHRLTTSGIYVLQCGDPTATGTGGPGYQFGPIENAPEDDVYPAGTLAMARRGGDGASMGSQFFLVYQDSTIPSDTAGGYTVFGTVTSGLDVVQAVADAGTVDGAGDGSPASPVIIEGVETQ